MSHLSFDGNPVYEIDQLRQQLAEKDVEAKHWKMVSSTYSGNITQLEHQLAVGQSETESMRQQLAAKDAEIERLEFALHRSEMERICAKREAASLKTPPLPPPPPPIRLVKSHLDRPADGSNPCITVREAIDVANEIESLRLKLADSQLREQQLRGFLDLTLCAIQSTHGNHQTTGITAQLALRGST